MCELCRKASEDFHKNGTPHISSLIDALQVGTNDEWETSEPILIGGPPGKYRCDSPFLGDCEWRCDLASAGASTAQIFVGFTDKETSGLPDYTGASGVSYTGRSGLEGLSILVPANNTLPILSSWYYLPGAQNKLSIIISAGANAAFINLVFRQKRTAKKR